MSPDAGAGAPQGSGARPGIGKGRVLGYAVALLVAALVLLPGPDGTAAAAPRVDIYTSKWCTFCSALRAYLDARGIVYTEHDVNATMADRAAFRAMGGQGVPVVVVGNQMIQGFDPVRIEAALKAAATPGEAPAAEPATAQ